MQPEVLLRARISPSALAVQIRHPHIALAEEALRLSIETDFDGISTRVMTAEHLCAICMDACRLDLPAAWNAKARNCGPHRKPFLARPWSPSATTWPARCSCWSTHPGSSGRGDPNLKVRQVVSSVGRAGNPLQHAGRLNASPIGGNVGRQSN